MVSDAFPTVPDEYLICYPMYACAMARLKYAMDEEPLPDWRDAAAIYAYYKRIYNTEGGASNFYKSNKIN